MSLEDVQHMNPGHWKLDLGWGVWVEDRGAATEKDKNHGNICESHKKLAYKTMGKSSLCCVEARFENTGFNNSFNYRLLS